MKFSIITVSKNSAKTIGRTIQSVLDQCYGDYEHIIKDCFSDDGTLTIAGALNPSCILINEPDKGIYDGMNQGFAHSKGDVSVFLNSDDYFCNGNVLQDVANTFLSSDCDFVYGNIKMIDTNGVVLREWKTGKIDVNVGLKDRQIPHPALFIRNSVLHKLETPFDSTYKISADLKQQLFIINILKLRGIYLDKTLTIMQHGGASTSGFGSYLKGWRESSRAYNEVIGSGGMLYVIRKVMSKIPGLQLKSYFGLYS
jgi:glycosyltransferase involved in cell wall biosynthesis